MAHHHPPSTPDTVRRGAFDAALPPVLEIGSGGTVAIDRLPGGEACMPCSLAAGLRVARTVDVNKGIHVTLEKAFLDIQQGQGT